MAKATSSAKPRSMRFGKRVQKAVDGGVGRAEGIHKRVASFPLEIMEQLDLFEDTVKQLRAIQDRSIGAGYDIVRDASRDVIRLARKKLRSARAKADARAHKAELKKAKKVAKPRPHAAAHEAA